MSGLSLGIIAFFFLPVVLIYASLLRVPIAGWRAAGLSRSFWFVRLFLMGPLGLLPYMTTLRPALLPGATQRRLSTPRLLGLAVLALAFPFAARAFVVFDADDSFSTDLWWTMLVLCALVLTDYLLVALRALKTLGRRERRPED